MRCTLLIPTLVLASIAPAQQPGQWWWFYADSLQHYRCETGDEFNGRSLDRRFWMTISEGRRNHHGKHMLEDNSDGKNAMVGDGSLRIHLTVPRTVRLAERVFDGLLFIAYPQASCRDDRSRDSSGTSALSDDPLRYVSSISER